MIINVYGPGHQYEVWLVIRGGKVFEYVENDGHSALRHGLQSQEHEITLTEVAELGRRYGKPDLIEQVREAVEKLE